MIESPLKDVLDLLRLDAPGQGHRLRLPLVAQDELLEGPGLIGQGSPGKRSFAAFVTPGIEVPDPVLNLATTRAEAAWRTADFVAGASSILVIGTGLLITGRARRVARDSPRAMA